ncbi:YIP1 family protein [Halorarum halophilum]|uniref:YIP1 family protein n=1 Tax=Halorarum halophilum TaxID=2743090 RepID=A0A7D5KLD0_9EURY|nr:YIP1 family protein [Halobaculum halophilum]QLG26722.1 YIP1 family protein [Halobaculum halophilum]
MTTWVEDPEGGRARGPRGLARAWVEVLVRPGRFFRTGVSPGDQAPGLVFAICVAVAFVGGRFLHAYLRLGDPFAFPPGSVPTVFGGPVASALLVLALTGLLVAPAILHLTAALQTALLIPIVRDRGGVSETVQVIAYASAPCALAGPPVPGLRAACALYGAALLVLGLREVHGTSTLRAAAAGAIPATLVFGVGFRGLDALSTLLGEI